VSAWPVLDQTLSIAVSRNNIYRLSYNTADPHAVTLTRLDESTGQLKARRQLTGMRATGHLGIAAVVDAVWVDVNGGQSEPSQLLELSSANVVHDRSVTTDLLEAPAVTAPATQRERAARTVAPVPPGHLPRSNTET
jgi:hypothetical protein